MNFGTQCVPVTITLIVLIVLFLCIINSLEKQISQPNLILEVLLVKLRPVFFLILETVKLKLYYFNNFVNDILAIFFTLKSYTFESSLQVCASAKSANKLKLFVINFSINQYSITNISASFLIRVRMLKIILF